MAYTTSRVVAGLRCPKLLWWRENGDDAGERDLQAGGRSRGAGRREVRRHAQAMISGGLQISVDRRNPDQMLLDTRDAMDAGHDVIYDATFLGAGTVVHVDILSRLPEGWCLTEVKAAARPKRSHVRQAAVKRHVLVAAGLDVARVEVVHLNRACRYPDLSSLLVRSDITSEVLQHDPTVAEALDAIPAILSGPQPNTPTGRHCTNPYPCPLLDRCRPPQQADAVELLYRGGKRVDRLRSVGVRSLGEIPASATLNPVQQRQRRAALTKQVVVDAALRGRLDRLRRFPIAFLDFECLQLPVPRWAGCGPFEMIPAQFSCHVLAEGGGLSHHAHLAAGTEDPRPALARALLEACGEAMTVWMYSNYEARCIRGLAAAVPELATELLAVVDRLVDMQQLLKSHVYHLKFRGSFSIKSVLPALVPMMDYAQLEIADGRSASSGLEALFIGDLPMESRRRSQLREALLEYCRLDTLAMVALWREMVSLTRDTKERTPSG